MVIGRALRGRNVWWTRVAGLTLAGFGVSMLSS
jgi:hypothetical protein